MTCCRVCQQPIKAPSLTAPAPALTSMMTFVDIPTVVHVCEACGHSQCDDLPDIDSFYDTSYRISLESDEHDQIFAVDDKGRPIYRTDHQAALGLSLLDLPEGALVLDYGAAKATTLRKMVATRPDLHPHVFDVSSDYKPAWQGWVAPEDQATYTVPETWKGRFHAIISHFVIEHVAAPVEFLKTLRDLLAPGGRVLLSMPDVAANPGDMTVADHLNHFSAASLKTAFALSGLSVEIIDSTSFPGAFFAVAMRSDSAVENPVSAEEIATAVARALEICGFWEKATGAIDGSARKFAGRRAAVYGSGFYGSWIHSRVSSEVQLDAFLDQNPNLQGKSHFGRPVLAPDQVADDVEVLFVGLNPLKARNIIAQVPALNRKGLELVWIDG